MDVEGPGHAQHATDDRAVGELLTASALGCTEYQLRPPLGAREIDQGRGDVVAYYLVIGTTQLLQQLALRREVIVIPARRKAVADHDMHPAELAFRPARHSGGAPDERVATRR